MREYENYQRNITIERRKEKAIGNYMKKDDMKKEREKLSFSQYRNSINSISVKIVSK